MSKKYSKRNSFNLDDFSEIPSNYKYGGIHIKPSHKGRFTEYLKRTGNTLEEALHSTNPHVRQMANFARNAKKWHHAYGGVDKPGYYMSGVVPPYREGNIMNPNDDNNWITPDIYTDNKYQSYYKNQLNLNPMRDTYGNPILTMAPTDRQREFVSESPYPPYPVDTPIQNTNRHNDFTRYMNHINAPVFAKNSLNPLKKGFDWHLDIPSISKEGTDKDIVGEKATPKELPVITDNGDDNNTDWLRAASYIGQSIPAWYNYFQSRKPIEKTQYPMTSPYLVDNTEERRQMKENADIARNVIARNLRNNNVGSYASNMSNATAGIMRTRGQQLGQSYQNQEQQNANILNRNQEMNIQRKIAMIEADKQAKAIKQMYGAKTAEQIGMLAGQIGSDMLKTQSDYDIVNDMFKSGNWEFKGRKIVWRDGSVVTKEDYEDTVEKKQKKNKKSSRRHLFDGRVNRYYV